MKAENFEIALSRLREYIASGNRRNTPEREEVLKAAYSQESRFTFNEIQEYIAENSKYVISSTTIYSSLKLFVDLGFMRCIRQSSRSYYDISLTANTCKQVCRYCGKTTYLDYWMFDALGDVYAKKGNHLKSIENYERAITAYYAMFNMTEKDMLKSPRQDNTLGDTLFDLARQYASNGNVMKSQHCYFVAAKCGNVTAIDVCKKYNIKR